MNPLRALFEYIAKISAFERISTLLLLMSEDKTYTQDEIEHHISHEELSRKFSHLLESLQRCELHDINVKDGDIRHFCIHYAEFSNDPMHIVFAKAFALQSKLNRYDFRCLDDPSVSLNNVVWSEDKSAHVEGSVKKVVCGRQWSEILKDTQNIRVNLMKIRQAQEKQKISEKIFSAPYVADGFVFCPEGTPSVDLYGSSRIRPPKAISTNFGDLLGRIAAGLPVDSDPDCLLPLQRTVPASPPEVKPKPSPEVKSCGAVGSNILYMAFDLFS